MSDGPLEHNPQLVLGRFNPLWDDDWSCVGGPEPLVSSLLSHPLLGGRTRRVGVDEDATPPGHESR